MSSSLDLALTAVAADVRALRADPGSTVVFNLEVEGHHNYFAGGMLVHDKDIPGNTEEP